MLHIKANKQQQHLTGLPVSTCCGNIMCVCHCISCCGHLYYTFYIICKIIFDCKLN